MNGFKCLKTIDNDTPILCLCLLPNNRLACGTSAGTIHILDVNTYSKIDVICTYYDHNIQCIKLINKKKFAVASTGRIFILSTSLGYEFLKSLKSFSSDKQLYCLEVNDECNILISAGEDKTIEIWDVEKGERLKMIELNSIIFDLKFIKENILAIGLDKQVDNLVLYDIEANKHVKFIEGHRGLVYCLNFLKLGHLVTTSADKTIKFWLI